MKPEKPGKRMKANAKETEETIKAKTKETIHPS